MRKLIIILAICILFTGCYDYKELNDCLVVSGVFIDKINDSYTVTYETIDTKKKEDNKNLFSGKGKSVSMAFQNTNQSLPKEAILSHIKVLFIGEELAKEGILEVLTFLISDIQIHSIFYPVIVKGKTSEILNLKDISTTIQNEIDFNEQTLSYASKQGFRTLLDTILDKRKDGIINVVEKSGDQVLISGLGLFFKDKLVTTLDIHDSSTLQTLLHSSTYYYEVPCSKNSSVIFNSHQNNTPIYSFQNDKINIKTHTTSSVIESTCNLDFRNPKTIEDLEQKSKEKLTSEFTTLYQKLKHFKTDVLGIQKSYYLQTREDLKDWYLYDAKFDVDVSTNKNGLIFEVKQ